MKNLISMVIFLIFFMYPVLSKPTVVDVFPKNGSYIYGGDSDVFSIEVISPSNVVGYLYVRVKDPTSVWKEISMMCFNLNPWICNTTVPGLEALLAEGKHLLYYFKVSNSDGTIFYGNETNPLEVLVDRTPPTINLSFPYSEVTYVSDRKRLSFLIKDALSGVNPESVVILFSYGNETWNSSWIRMLYDEGRDLYVAPWNTSELPDNSSWIVYVNASDNVGNYNVTKIGVFYIDNEKPRIIEYSPKENSGLWKIVEIFVKGEDKYSGINRLEISISNFFYSTSCREDTCRHFLDTLKFQDGYYTLNLTLFDNVENFVSISIPVKIDNTFPVLSLEYPSEYLSKIVVLTLKIGNIERILEAKVRVSNLTWQNEENLGCVGFVCNFTINTREYSDGRYTLTFSIKNEVNYVSTYSKSFVFDNTPPTILGGTPVYENKTVKLSVGIFDENGVDSSSVKIEFLNKTFYPSCRVLTEGRRVICEIEIREKLNTSEYLIRFYGYDLARNENFDEKVLKVVDSDNESKKDSEKRGSGFRRGWGSDENGGENVKKGSGNATGAVDNPLDRFLRIVVPVEGISFGTVVFLVALLFLVVGVSSFVIFLMIRKGKGLVFMSKLANNVKKDIDSIEMALKILNMSGESLLEEKEFLMNVRKIIEGIPKTSPVQNEYNKLVQVSSGVLKEKIKEYSGSVKKLEKREFLGKVIEEIEKVLNIDDVKEIRKSKKTIIEMLVEGKKVLEEELKVALELEKIVGEVS
ncbi:MAG: hypothetical protein N3D78_00025 [Candidatus Aenigmarchaeota archaeon]|nr:hypothetical protein [Candidatus Aenigmarchaeota archaeon]